MCWPSPASVRRSWPNVSKEALGDSITVATGAARSRAEFGDVRQARSDLQEMAASLIGSVVVIAGLVLTGTLSLIAHRRRRQIALLRAVGASSRHVTRMIAAETAAVALLAGLIGCLPGGLLAALLLDALRLAGLAPDDFEISVGPVPMLAAVAACLLSRHGQQPRPLAAAGRHGSGLLPAVSADVRKVPGVRPGTVAISRAAAGTLSAKAGSTLTLYLGDGTPYRPEVVAIYGRGSGFGDLTLPRVVINVALTI